MEETNSKFTSGLLGLLGVKIFMWVIILITCGLGTPWAVCIYQKWLADNTIIDGHHLSFDGDGVDLFVLFIKWLLMTIITLGIYGFWIGIRIRQWTTAHTHIKD